MTNSSRLFNTALSLIVLSLCVSACGLKEQPKPPAGSVIMDPKNYPKEAPQDHCHCDDE